METVEKSNGFGLVEVDIILVSGKELVPDPLLAFESSHGFQQRFTAVTRWIGVNDYSENSSSEAFQKMGERSTLRFLYFGLFWCLGFSDATI
jgi:hypothetical protein